VVVFAALVRVVVGGVVVGVAGTVPKVILAGDEWKLNTPTSPATVASRTIEARFTVTHLVVARSLPRSSSRRKTIRDGYVRAARRVDEQQ